jgi:8-oxo-dGTP diphosphatase
MLIDAIVSIIIKGDKVLLIERGPKTPFAGFWGPVSGKVDPGESQEEAVARESKEEVGLNVLPVLKVWENISSDGAHRLHWWLSEYVSGVLALDAREAAAARWLTSEEIKALKVFERDREFYEQVLPTLLKEK